VPVQHPIKPRNLGIDFFVTDLPFFYFFTDGWRHRKDPTVRSDLSELSHWPDRSSSHFSKSLAHDRSAKSPRPSPY
jgi:hypothetical protein